MQKFIPFLDWIKDYNSTLFKGDISAGLTVGVMLIPQGMAYAMIAGLPPIYGLYASTLPLIIYALLGTSRQLAVGPVAMVSLLTATGVGAIADGGTEQYLMLAVLLAFMVGMIQFLMGAFRLGFLVSFLSHPVISGFTSAAALIIGLSQLKHLLGINLARSHHVHEIIIQAFQKISEVNIYTLGIGILGIILIKVAKKIHASIPAQLVAVVFGILIVWGLGLTDKGVKIVGEVPSGLPTFDLPGINMSNISVLITTALTIALVSFMESIAVAKAIQAKHKNYKVDANQELVALGLSNVVGSFFQSYPVTGGFSRTAVNDQAGAQTTMASIISALLVGLTLLFLTPLFYYLPNAILASVIMVAVFGLIDYKEAIHLWHVDRTDFWMLIVTFIATLTLGIEQGIGLGVLLSLAMIIYQSTYPHHAELGKVPDSHFYKNVSRFENLKRRNDIRIIRFDAPLFFANMDHFRKAVNAYSEEKTNEELKAVVLNFESINNVDSSALHVLEDMVENGKKSKIKVYFTGLIGPVRDKFQKTGLFEKIGIENIFLSVQDAVDCFDKRDQVLEDKEASKYELQSND